MTEEQIAAMFKQELLDSYEELAENIEETAQKLFADAAAAREFGDEREALRIQATAEGCLIPANAIRDELLRQRGPLVLQ